MIDQKAKKNKSSSGRKHGSFKGSNRKGGHGPRKDYKDLSSKDHDRTHTQKGRSPSRHHRKTTFKKVISPSPGGSRKSRKQNSPQTHKRVHKRSTSPRDRLEYHARAIERSLSHGRDSSLGPSRPRDPRIEDRLKRSPDGGARGDRFGARDSPRRYDREDYGDKRERRSPPGGARGKDLERKEITRHRDTYDPRDREAYEERCREDLRREARDKDRVDPRDPRDPREPRDPRDKKPLRDREVYRDRECDIEEKKGRYHRDSDYQRERDLSVRGRCFDDDRDFFPRPPPPPPGDLDSRESSVERPYDDPYDRYSDHDRLRYDGPRGGRYDNILSQDHRNPIEYSPLDDVRLQEERRGRQQPSLEARFPDERRKRGSSLERSHPDTWGEDRPTSSVMDRIQDLKGGGDHFSHHSHRLQHPHQGTPIGLPHRRGEWLEPELPTPVGRVHPGHMWDKHHAKKRRSGGDWPDEFPVTERAEWEEGMEWNPQEQRERIHPPPPSPHEKAWGGPHHPRRFHGNWNNELDRERGEWTGPVSIQERLGGRVRLLQPIHHPLAREGPLHIHSGQRNRNIQRKEPVMIEQDSLDNSSPQGLNERNRSLDGESGSEVTTPTKRPSLVDLPPLVKQQLQQQQQQLSQPPPSQTRVMDSPQGNLSTPFSLPPEPFIEKDNFSDFSDDPDDILNQEVDEETLAGMKESTNEDKSVMKEGISYEDMLEEEERMDLEEISDEEFEEEKQAKFSVADALDINWSSLISDVRARPMPTQGSALKRFRPLRLLARLGVSTKYARPEVLQKVTDECLNVELKGNDGKPTGKSSGEGYRMKIKEERNKIGSGEPKEEMNEEVTVKIEHEETDETLDSVKVKGEPDENVSKDEPLPTIHPVVVPGGVIRCLQQESMGRLHLFNLGSHRKALCAKEDLYLRRRLCNLPEEELIGVNVQYDPQLFREAVELLKMGSKSVCPPMVH